VRFETYLSPNLPDIRFEPKHQLNAPEFPGYQVLCSLAESNGVTWVGTDGDGLLRVRPRLITSYLVQDGERNGNAFVDSRGRIWSATDESGVAVKSPDGGQRHFGVGEGFTARHVTSFAETPDGEIWVGSDGMGLWRISGDTVKHERYSRDVGGEFIRVLFCDSEGALWIGTRGDLVTRLKDGNAKTVRFVRLATTTPRFFHEEPKGRIWLETDKLLFSFMARDFTDAADSSGAGCRTETFSAEDGYVFRAGERTRVSQPAYAALCAMPRPHVVIETPSPSKVFPPDAEEILVRYTADVPGMADRVTYSVRLLPKREEWRYVQRTHRQRYGDLPPGRYRFEVRARLPWPAR